jgi:hypothetical protein
MFILELSKSQVTTSCGTLISMKNRILLLFTLITLAAQVYAQDSCGIIWSPPVELSASGLTPRITVQGGAIHIVWFAGGSLPYVRSTNDGVTWETVQDLWIPDTAREPGYRWILSNKDRVFMLWSDYAIESGKASIAYRISTDRGIAWGEVMKYTDSRGTDPYDAVLSNNTLVVQFIYGSGGWTKILRSTDEGNSWSVGSDSITGYNARLALSNGTLHLVHQPYLPDIITAPESEYRRSTDLGDTWEIISFLSDNDGNSSTTPAVAASSRKVFTAWRDAKYGCGSSFGCNIVGRLSTDNGTSWQSEQILTEEPYGDIPEVVMKGNLVVVGWFDDLDTIAYVRIRVSFDGGSTWCSPVNLGIGAWVKIAISETAIHVVWEQQYPPGNFHVMYSRGALPDVNVPVSINGRWNMVSVPVHAADTRKSILFPSAVSHAFTFRGNGYVEEDSLQVGRGYWLKFPAAETVAVTGVPIRVKEIPVHTGWNMVGAIASPTAVTDVTTDPPNIISSQFFGYRSGYKVADTLFPGRGYWVKVSQAGTLILSE